jgi:RNA polymerase sigma-70 factor (ECF subfamily)
MFRQYNLLRDFFEFPERFAAPPETNRGGERELLMMTQQREATTAPVAREEFGELVERYQRRIFRVCMGVTKNQDAAEACMQKTFILALENLDQYRAEAQFSTWLTRIALNVAVSHLRRENSQAGALVSIDAVETGELPLSLPDHRPSPETDCWRGEVRRLIRQALESLSPRMRMVFLLRDVEELNTEETARILGITEAAVKTRLLRARLQLRELLAPALSPSRHPSAPSFAVQ